MQPESVDVSVVVPTYREAPNLRILVPRVSSALGATGRTFEIIIADDDSRDGTDTAVAEMASVHPVRLIVRTERRDLSLAVLDGFRAARGSTLVVMDADLSHPPEKIPDLLDALDQPGVDFVIGSRFVAGGGTTSDWGGGRRVNSGVATLLARPLAHGIADPMSGFFALRRSTLERADQLDPIGYKIGLELICRCRCERVVEVPITFPNRKIGTSKLNFEQQRRYLVHLNRLYRDCRPGAGLLMRPVIWGMRAGIGVCRAISRK